MTSAGIFGPKLSGKTTLAIRISQIYHERFGMSSMVLDPHMEAWGKQAWATADESKFWPTVWNSQGKVVIVEEAAATIRRERDLVPVFTRLRHCNHKLIVVGHNGMDLLPVMREQFDTLYLFRQPKSAAKVWAEVFCEDRLLSTVSLAQFEYLFCQLYHAPKKCRLKKVDTPAPV